MNGRENGRVLASLKEVGIFSDPVFSTLLVIQLETNFRKEVSMREYGISGIIATIVFSLLCGIHGAFAEPYVGGYLGFASAADSDFANADLIVPTPPSTTLFPDLDLSTEIDTSFTFGARAGYWFDFWPKLGAQFDFYTFSPDVTIPDQPISGNTSIGDKIEFDVSVVAFGFSVLGRYPFLVSPEFPRGRLQPHLGIGPAIFITSWDDQESTPNENVGSETVVNGGLQFLTGVSYFIFEKVAAFAEYKFTHHVTQIGGVARNFSLVGNQPFNVSHFVIGVTYHFY